MKTRFKFCSGMLAMAAVMAAVGCTEDSRYNYENIEKSIQDGQEITVFQNGLTVPVGNTAQLRLDSLLQKSGISDSLGKFLKVSDNGDYYILYDSTYNMDNILKDFDLQEIINIKGLSGKSAFENHIGNINADDLKVAASNIGAQQQFSDFTDALNLKLDTCNVAIPTPGIGAISFDMPVPMKAMTLPSGVEKINSVTLTNSSLTFKFGGQVSNLSIVFPSYMTVSGNGVSGNTLTLSQTSAPHEVSVNITKLTLSEPVSGKINFPADPIKVSCTVSNHMITKLVAKFEISDFEAVISKIEKDITTDTKKIEMNLDEAFDDFGTVTVHPVGSPKILLSLSMPDLGTASPTTDGIVIQLPDVVRLKNVPSGLVYDAANSKITLKSLKSANYELPVDKLVITPVKNGDKCYVSSSYGATGKVQIAKTTVSKGTIAKVSGAQISFSAAIPEIKAESIEVSELKVDVDITQELTEFQKIEIPEMLVSVGDIVPKDLYLNMDIDAAGLPDIGDSKFQVNLKATAPSFVVPNEFNITGTMTVKDSKASFAIAPVKIEKLDFSKVNLDDARNGSIKDCNIKVSGTISAKDPVVDLSTIKADMTGNVNYSLYSTGNSKGGIDIQSIEAKLDYKVDTTIYVNTTSVRMPDAITEFVADLPLIDINTTISTNTSVPMSMDMDICLVKGTTADKTNPLVSHEFSIPYSTDGSVCKTSDSFSMDMNRLFNDKPDSLLLEINAATDPSKITKINTGTIYSLGLDYEVSAPLQLGDNFSLVLKDTLKVNAEIGDYLAGNSALLSAKAVNTLPLGLELKVALLCDDQTVVDDIMDKPLEIKSASTTDINVKIYCKEGIKKVTGLIFTLSANASGECIRPDNYIQLTDVTVSLPEGVTVNIKK